MNATRKKTLALLKAVIDGKPDAGFEEVERINKYFVDQYKVHIFDIQSPNSILVEMDNSFEDVCFILESHGIQRPKELSIYEFQRKLELIKKHAKPKGKPAS